MSCRIFSSAFPCSSFSTAARCAGLAVYRFVFALFAASRVYDRALKICDDLKLSRGENEGFTMKDNIIFRKIWQDDDVMELTVECSSPLITATSEIYVSDSLIDELISEITRFLNGNKEGFWANEERGDASTACVSFRFFREDALGHIAIEVFAELDDGGDYSKHNCCFFVRTEYGLLINFCDHLVQLKNGSVGCEIRLNCF